ncbi:MAG: S8 family serine peptidase [Saprospiraceae bacterium]
MKFGGISLLLTIILFRFAPASLQAQEPAFIDGQILVSLRPGDSPAGLALRYARLSGNQHPETPERVSHLLNIWLFHCENDLSGTRKALEWFRRQPEVSAAQLNHLLESRQSVNPPLSLTPDDPLFPLQWQYLNDGANGGVPDADLDAPEAWDYTTGGLSAAGDTIVVAIIDSGVNPNHADLAPNLWVNWADVPADGLDNDANGYIDDTRGWNIYLQNDQINGFSTTHGTAISGIIGARGNNGLGVSGINWRIKMMSVVGNGQESTILSAYDYVYQARLRYNQTHGQQGAFVVAVNCSWGINYGHPEDAPLWCAAFDTLGAAGILSVAAAANLPVDVDLQGDLPTTCPSNFLVSVTSLNNADQIAPDASWGAQSVDLGAYGVAVYTTSSAGTDYAAHSGTSFATPQVSGAIGLLYAAPCPDLIALAKNHPAEAALWVKNRLLGSVSPNAAMNGATVSNGRLNLGNLLAQSVTDCAPCPAPFALFASSISTSSALLNWSEISDFETVMLRWRKKGEDLWNYEDAVSPPFLLDNLQACSEYEFGLYADCAGSQSSSWSESAQFRTDGCCEAPSGIAANELTSASALLSWMPVTAAQAYHLRLRPASGGNWATEEVSGGASFNWIGLAPCTQYEVQVGSDCDSGSIGYSGSYFFSTPGCGVCADAAYCAALASLATEEWIAGVQIGDWQHYSGGFLGYENFTGQSADGPQLYPLSAYPVTLTPGYSGWASKVFFRIYVDFNADGDFDDAGELAFDPGFAVDVPYSGFLQTPDFWAFGPTRLRVLMKYKGAQGLAPGPCENFEFGQVEDYCASLSPVGLETADSRAAAALRIYPQPAATYAWLEIPETAGALYEWEIWSPMGTRMLQEKKSRAGNRMFVDLATWPPGVYFVRLTVGELRFQGKIVKGCEP